MKVSLTSILYKMKGVAPFTCGLVLLASCQGNSYRISGDAVGLEDGDTLFLTHDFEMGTPSDTLIVSDGKFQLSGETDSTALCMIYSMKRNEINAPFFLEPGHITIHLTEEPGASRVGGTHCNDQWQVLNDSVISIGKEINRIAGRHIIRIQECNAVVRPKSAICAVQAKALFYKSRINLQFLIPVLQKSFVGSFHTLQIRLIFMAPWPTISTSFP